MSFGPLPHTPVSRSPVPLTWPVHVPSPVERVIRPPAATAYTSLGLLPQIPRNRYIGPSCVHFRAGGAAIPPSGFDAESRSLPPASGNFDDEPSGMFASARAPPVSPRDPLRSIRSEERRVGKECRA